GSTQRRFRTNAERLPSGFVVSQASVLTVPMVHLGYEAPAHLGPSLSNGRLDPLAYLGLVLGKGMLHCPGDGDVFGTSRKPWLTEERVDEVSVLVGQWAVIEVRGGTGRPRFTARQDLKEVESLR